MELKKNPVKQALRGGQTVFGIYIGVPSPVMVELAGYAGFDFVRIDVCHCAADLPIIADMIRAAEASGVTPMIRLDYDPYLIAKVLEAGAMGLFIPDVSTHEMARSVVDAVHFAPLGDRGTFAASRITRYGAIGSGEYAKWSNEELLLGVQIESKEAADNLEKTLGVDGIDMIGSGRGDLANALGLTGQKNHPSVLALEEKIFDTAKKRGKYVSVNLDPTARDFAETVAAWKNKAQVITLGHDLTLLRKHFGDAIATARRN
ncbi:MAG: aldolase/citrate lyase family protein [Deltaproteobacteria bacterium]|nr:aldolase/citrate lyase family protein [Deltaproteobacteria bacterium]